jgi:hypothetical protein
MKSSKRPPWSSNPKEVKKEISSQSTSLLKKYLAAALVIFSSLLLQVNPIAAQTPAVKNIVIAHAAFGDGSGWKGVYTMLTKKGYHVTIVQNPLTSLDDDVEATNRILNQQKNCSCLAKNGRGRK